MKVIYRGNIVKTEQGGLITLFVANNKKDVKDFLTKVINKGKTSGIVPTIEMTMEFWFKKRTLSQNNLLHALCAILSQELSGHNLDADDIYYDLIATYGAWRKGAFHEEMIPKRGSEMNTKEFARVIQGAFDELASLGVTMDNSADVKNYWQKFTEFKHEIEAEDQEVTDIEDPALPPPDDPITAYRKGTTICEASGKFIGVYGEDTYIGQVAHIKSKGAGGTDEAANFLHLHPDVHVPEQHQHGWGEFLVEYSHLRFKVEKALGYHVPPPPSPDGSTELDIF